jgi:hypothetical protein
MTDHDSAHAPGPRRKKTRDPGPRAAAAPALAVERVQTGVRMERRILKVLKGLAELHDLTLGDLLEGIVLHVFEGKLPFGEPTLRKIAELKRVYQLDLDASASHRMVDKNRAG